MNSKFQDYKQLTLNDVENINIDTIADGEDYNYVIKNNDTMHILNREDSEAIADLITILKQEQYDKFISALLSNKDLQATLYDIYENELDHSLQPNFFNEEFENIDMVSIVSTGKIKTHYDLSKFWIYLKILDLVIYKTY